jgi:hypothetical protein
VPLVIEPMLRVGALVRSGTPKGNGLLQSAYDRALVTAGYSAYLLDYTRTHALSGGSREAASIIIGATSAVPNSENTYLGFRLVASGIE